MSTNRHAYTVIEVNYTNQAKYIDFTHVLQKHLIEFIEAIQTITHNLTTEQPKVER